MNAEEITKKIQGVADEIWNNAMRPVPDVMYMPLKTAMILKEAAISQQCLFEFT